MSNLKIELNQTDAIAFYNNANAAGKELLEKKFGKEIFNLKITDRVKTFEDACAVLGTSPAEALTHKGCFLTPKQKRANAADKLETIIEALNEGWTPDWKDGNQTKFYPWFEYGSKGFSLNYVVAYCRSTRVPSCLCSKNRDIATYAATQFISIYNEYLN